MIPGVGIDMKQLELSLWVEMTANTTWKKMDNVLGS